jgi:hypothetical protein
MAHDADGTPSSPTSATPGGDTAISRPSLLVEHTAMWLVDRPWLAVVAMAAVTVWLPGRAAFAGWRHRHHINHGTIASDFPTTAIRRERTIKLPSRFHCSRAARADYSAPTHARRRSIEPPKIFERHPHRLPRL